MRKKQTISPDELDLFQLADASRELEQRKKSLEDIQRKVRVERDNHENTLPPSDVVSTIQKRKHLEVAISRNDVRTIQRDQQSAILLLILLIAMTVTFIWLGFKLMQGG